MNKARAQFLSVSIRSVVVGRLGSKQASVLSIPGIVYVYCTCFRALHDPPFFPPCACAVQINNGVYRAGFATSQTAYEKVGGQTGTFCAIFRLRLLSIYTVGASI